MEWVPQILQLPVIINWGRSLSSQLQSLQKRDFLFGVVATQGCILEELFEPWFYGDGAGGRLLGKLESLPDARGQPPAQRNFHAKALQVDIPRVDHRIQEGDAVFNGYVKNVRIQEFENRNAHLLITALARLG